MFCPQVSLQQLHSPSVYTQPCLVPPLGPLKEERVWGRLVEGKLVVLVEGKVAVWWEMPQVSLPSPTPPPHPRHPHPVSYSSQTPSGWTMRWMTSPCQASLATLNPQPRTIQIPEAPPRQLLRLPSCPASALCTMRTVWTSLPPLLRWRHRCLGATSSDGEGSCMF